MGTLRDQILDAKDLPIEEVQTDEWAPFGVPFVRVRGLSASEKEKWERSLPDEAETKSKKPTKLRERFVVLTVVDEQGNPEFTDADLQMLSERSSVVITRIFDAARKLSGMLTDAEAAALVNPSKAEEEDDSSSTSA
jgi:hypothetical protein